MGEYCLFVQGGRAMQKIQKENVVALDGLVMIFHMQQPTKNTWTQCSGDKRAGATWGEHAGGIEPSFWGVLEVERR
jgi:hypothetical protein